MNHRLTRRETLRVLAAGTGLGATNALAEPLPPTQGQSPSAASQPPGVCVLFPEAVEGPYYFDPQLVRSNIADGRPGVPLELVLKVIENGPCTPLANARVDVWHADAGGIYSGYAGQGDKRDTSTKGEKYLRGTQMTDAGGNVVFRTIYPGWYPGRTPHIHVKTLLDEKTMLTGQVYFPDDLSARIYRERQPYATRPVSDTTNTTDFIFRAGEREGGGIVFAIQEKPDLIIAALVIAVDRSGKAARRSTGRWPGFLRGLFGRE